MVTVSFPGLGIGEISFNKVALSLFGTIEVRWYGIIMVTGIILAFLYAYYRSKHEGVSFDDLLDYAIFTVLSGIVGARLYYVITSGQKYTFGEIFAIWNGGIAIYGAIIGGATALLCVSLYKKIKWQKVFDMVCPGVMIGQIVGRWGNFFNGEAYGESPAEDSLLYFMRMELRHEGWSNSYICQPTFLYESLWNLVGFLIINALYKKKKFDGQVFLMYITWYGFGRMFIEGLRTDSLMVGTFRISQVVAFLCFIVGFALLVYLGVRASNRAKLAAAEGEVSTYGNMLNEENKTETEDESKEEENNVGNTD
ncbi:MAG: prolipoprotein diacylglyceryl transferase [Clostridia bacterium]|nr:prolipoprotein diacylglyceryl transferase [Clostridia bacterium]